MSKFAWEPPEKVVHILHNSKMTTQSRYDVNKALAERYPREEKKDNVEKFSRFPRSKMED